ncbi:MAG: NitT/TauT family transport system substrate-binding protein [Gammaproteobacteria bacterium]
MSISFNSGKSALTENAKTIIDLQFSEVAKSYSNTRIRVEGNTDSDGNDQMNKKLSLKRAQSVADYLEKQYGMNGNRFIILGNGEDRPVPGCEKNQNADCKAKNRRTEFQLVAG